MKANEAPEKIYVDNPNHDFGIVLKTKTVLNTPVLMPLLRRRVMLIVKFVGIILILFLRTFADKIVDTLMTSKTI